MSEIKTNKISSLTSSNSDITLDPDGTGSVVVSGSTLTANTTDNFPITWQGASGGATGALYGDGSAVGMFNGAAFTTGVWANNSNEVYVRNNGSNTVKIDSSGKVGINTTDPVLKFNVDTGDMVLSRTTDGDGNELGEFMFWNRTNAGSGTGTTFVNDVASMQGKMVGTGNNSGGSLHFYTKADAGDKTERLRIDGSGNVMFQTTDPDAGINNATGSPQFSFRAVDGLRASTSGSHYFNKLYNDGVILSFRGEGTTEGSISLSGTTVSYNGGHLARWSQLADNTKDTSIVKGTVMTNLDQMAEWTKDGVTEDNEQLNCMAVSSVEGDANVAGVFVNWDDDDEDYTADMNIAMTGDMVIRIAQGTTVARGDLLMSAGDGTAKPQGDDIVRSKTIAKVTSTTVSHTYDDGSYLVPCVLMAC